MWQLVKRDYSIIGFFIPFAVIFKITLYILATFSLFLANNIYYANFLFLMLYAFLFLTDNKSKVMQTIVSLPIKKRHIIASRYISLFSIGLIILTVAFVLDYVVDARLFSIIEIYLGIGALTLYVAISTPVYYLFKKGWVSVIIHYMLIILSALFFAFVFADPFDWFYPVLDVGFSLLDKQPLIVSGLGLIITMYLSYRLSYFIFKRKDILS